MSNVHKLTSHVLPGEANAVLVEVLRGLLERAERGEIVSMAWAHYSGTTNDTVSHGWEYAGGTAFQMHSAVTVLNHRLTQSFLEDCTCP